MPRIASLVLPASLLLLLASPAAADRFTFGISLGQNGGADSAQPSPTRGVFFEAQLARRVAVQVELSRLTPANGPSRVRRLAAAAIVDLTAPRRLTPFALAGLADERRDAGSYYPGEYRSREVGVGLALRFGANLVASLDARVGERTAVDPVVLQELPPFVPWAYDAGRYTSLRLGVGVRF